MESISERVARFGAEEDELQVVLSSEIIGLLSEQLYKSPIKAIEELVVNSYDADATECRIGISPGAEGFFLNAVYVFDNGTGMDHAGLEDLWHVGHSKKKGDRLSSKKKRRQIGKFGIGKLATYSLAYRVTYITRSAGDDEVRATTLDYRKFISNPQGAGIPVKLPVRRLSISEILAQEDLVENLKYVGIQPEQFAGAKEWTLVVLEDLREGVREIQTGRLSWVLSTAMPLGDEFRCYLNGEQIRSSKEKYDIIASFSVAELSEKRISALNEKSGEDWRVSNNSLISSSFPSGVSGTAIVTLQSIYGLKSDDIIRSNGFFVKVRGRLVNIDDPLFGLRPLSYETFSRFRAEITADDLDPIITAPREGVEQGNLRQRFSALLEAVYYEARARYEEAARKKVEKEKLKNEGARNFVEKRLVERPTADALVTADAEKYESNEGSGAEADGSWFYIDVPADADLREIANNLYGPDRDQVYRYERINLGRSARMVSFDPVKAVFSLNADHDLVVANDDDAPSRKLLEDVVSAEALLEVYLREHGVSKNVIGEILEQRDQLWRSLVRDNIYSLAAISRNLLDSAKDERDLEVNLVVAARALGFVAKHLSGATNPDGIARLTDYPNGEKKITLEAKSSVEVPSLSAIDFGGLREHVVNERADGCLLIAPSYPGQSRDDNAAARRADDLKISCWTVRQLSSVIAAAESRHLTAQHVLDIVLTKFRPSDVESAVATLLSESKPNNRALYGAVIKALWSVEKRLVDRPRTMEIVATAVSMQPGFEEVRGTDVNRAIVDLAGASRGAMEISGERIILRTSIDELARRVGQLVGDPGPVPGPGTFRIASPSPNNGEID
ncbi:ATP-binding protein [Herbidospora daliensis]|uniref:ATP-binding protein n=1 Tax=Herbidospora daliensis TaxID=295585 RepID=UPI000B0158D4|nr:ATP-binding protein [Herbidospora daliensis]